MKNQYSKKQAKAIKRAKRLALQHWRYVAKTLGVHLPISVESTSKMAVSEYHYLSAFIHGYKHGLEDAK